MNFKSLTLLSFAAVLFSSAASGTTVYTDFGAGQSFNTGSEWNIGGSASTTPQEVAGSFQPSITVTLTSIDLAVVNLISGTASFTVEITANSSGAPGTVLESYTLSSITGTATVDTVTSTTHPTLSSGTTYWVVVLPGATTTLGGWNWNSQGATNFDFSSNGGSTWFPDSPGASPAFDVNGTSTTPEPASALLLLGGLGILGAFRRIRG